MRVWNSFLGYIVYSLDYISLRHSKCGNREKMGPENVEYSFSNQIMIYVDDMQFEFKVTLDTNMKLCGIVITLLDNCFS